MARQGKPTQGSSRKAPLKETPANLRKSPMPVMISSRGQSVVSGEPSTDNHNILVNRDLDNQHPISAITDLNTRLTHNLASHTDVTTTVASSAQRLVWNSDIASWEPRSSVSGLGFLEFNYKFDDSINGQPAPGFLSRDNNTPSQVTLLFVNSINRDGVDETDFWLEIKEGDWFNFSDSKDTDKYESYDVTGYPTLVNSVWTIPVSFYADGLSIADNRRVQLIWRISANYPHDVLVDRDAIESHPASAISTIPAGTITATDTASALNELDTKKAALSGATFTGQVKGITPVDSDDLVRMDWVLSQIGTAIETAARKALIDDSGEDYK
jgi:hypothetical protein